MATQECPESSRPIGCFSLAVRMVSACFCAAFPYLCDICADAQPKPLIETWNAAAIGQCHRHIPGTLQVRQYPKHTPGRNAATAIRRVCDDI